MKNAATQMENQQFSLHGGPGGGGSTQVRRFLILINIESLYLIKEVAVEAPLMDA